MEIKNQISNIGTQDDANESVKEANEIGNNENPNGVVEAATTQAYDNAHYLKDLTRDLKSLGILQFPLPSARLSDLKNAGYKFCNIKSQRPVNVNHVKALAKSLKDDGATEFSAKGIAIPAVAALEKGVEVVDADTGQAITVDTQDINKFFLIVDMQHRYATCMMKEGLDMSVVITDCPGDPEAMVLCHNKNQKPWDSNDFRRHYTEKNGKTDTLKSATDEGDLIFQGCSQKALEYAMTGKKDPVRKSDAQKGVIYELQDEQKEVGLDILRFLRLIANDEPKARRLEVMVAIHNAKASLANSISGQNFCKCLVSYASDATNEGSIKVMVSSVSKLEFEAFEKDLTKAIKKFAKDNKSAIDSLYESALNKFNETVSAPVSASAFKDAPLDVVLKVNAEKEARKQEAEKKKNELEAQLKALQKQVAEQKKAVKNFDFFDDEKK